MNELILNIIVGIISSFLGALILYIVQEFRDKKRKLIIDDIEDQRTIDRDVIEKLSPGYSVEKAKKTLGSPIIYKNEDETIFGVRLITNSYLYNFKNALIKITSQDNIKIDTITVLYKHKSQKAIKFIPSIFDKEVKPFGKYRLDKIIVDLVKNHTPIRTMKVASCAVEIYIPNPLYKNFTYFCGFSDNLEKYYKSNHVNDLLGVIIYGVCISEIEKQSFFIYEYEHRY